MTAGGRVIGLSPAADRSGAGREIVGAVLVFLTLVVVSSTVVLAIGGGGSRAEVVAGSLAHLVGSATALLVARAWRSSARFGGRWTAGKVVMAYAAFAVGTYAPFAFGVLLSWTQLGLPAQPQAPLDFLSGSGFTPGTLVVVAAVVLSAPLVEEVVFRGFLQTGLTARLGALRAILVTAAVFALLHVGSGAHLFLPIALLGVFLGWLRAWTGGLLAPVVAHATHNAAMIVISMLVAQR